MTGAKAHRKVSHLYFSVPEAAAILMPLDKEPTAAKRLMRSMGRRGYPPPIGPDNPLYAPTQMRFLPEVIYEVALELGTLDVEWFGKPEAWRDEVRLRFTALGKPLEGIAPSPEDQETAAAIFRNRPEPYQPKPQLPTGQRQCAECKGIFPVEQFRRNSRGRPESWCRPCHNRLKRLWHRRRHGNYDGEIATDRRDMYA